eukprot:3268198-Pyramimonas_sp.AAC.1
MPLFPGRARRAPFARGLGFGALRPRPPFARRTRCSARLTLRLCTVGPHSQGASEAEVHAGRTTRSASLTGESRAATVD